MPVIHEPRLSSCCVMRVGACKLSYFPWNAAFVWRGTKHQLGNSNANVNAYRDLLE